MADLMRLIALTFLAAASLAHAQVADPTRPPSAWLVPAEAAAQNVGESAGGLRLQSVLMPHGGRPVAVISGKTVVLGGQVGDARLVSLNEREAVLQGTDGVTHLYLTPEVEKQMIDTPKARKTGKSGSVKGTP